MINSMTGLLKNHGSSRVLSPVIMAVSGISLYIGAALAGWLHLCRANRSAPCWPSNLDIGVPIVIGLAAGLGLLSAAIPYSLDQVVLRLAGSSYFALLQAVLPLAAALVGAVALQQWLSLSELLGIVLIMCAIVLRKP